jgi:hypothetical protein
MHDKNNRIVLSNFPKPEGIVQDLQVGMAGRAVKYHAYGMVLSTLLLAAVHVRQAFWSNLAKCRAVLTRQASSMKLHQGSLCKCCCVCFQQRAHLEDYISPK